MKLFICSMETPVLQQLVMEIQPFLYMKILIVMIMNGWNTIQMALLRWIIVMIKDLNTLIGIDIIQAVSIKLMLHRKVSFSNTILIWRAAGGIGVA